MVASIPDVEAQLADLIDDFDFQALDESFGRFNLFEAIGAVRGELRHSNFLAFLLSPNEAHGLGTELLQRVLREFVNAAQPERRPLLGLEIAVAYFVQTLVDGIN
jgi:PD-(D/E)XK nuclease superfamily